MLDLIRGRVVKRVSPSTQKLHWTFIVLLRCRHKYAVGTVLAMVYLVCVRVTILGCPLIVRSLCCPVQIYVAPMESVKLQVGVAIVTVRGPVLIVLCPMSFVQPIAVDQVMVRATTKRVAVHVGQGIQEWIVVPSVFPVVKVVPCMGHVMEQLDNANAIQGGAVIGRLAAPKNCVPLIATVMKNMESV